MYICGFALVSLASSLVLSGSSDIVWKKRNRAENQGSRPRIEVFPPAPSGLIMSSTYAREAFRFLFLRKETLAEEQWKGSLCLSSHHGCIPTGWLSLEGPSELHSRLQKQPSIGNEI